MPVSCSLAEGLRSARRGAVLGFRTGFNHVWDQILTAEGGFSQEKPTITRFPGKVGELKLEPYGMIRREPSTLTTRGRILGPTTTIQQVVILNTQSRELLCDH